MVKQAIVIFKWAGRIGAAVVAGVISGCSPLAVLNQLGSDAAYTVIENVSYGSDVRQALDIYIPKQAPSGKVVVFFYGGSWSSGERGDYRFVAQSLTAHGIVVVIADYRLYPDVRFPAFVEDAAAAVGWTFRHIARYQGDPAKIYLIGHSAGGHIVSLLALDSRYLATQSLRSSLLAGVIGLSSPTDFAATLGARYRPIFTDDAQLETAQPVRYARADAAPMLLLHGADDALVLPRNSETLARRIQQTGGEARAIIYPDIGHPGTVLAFSPLWGQSPLLAEMLRFMDVAP